MSIAFTKRFEPAAGRKMPADIAASLHQCGIFDNGRFEPARLRAQAPVMLYQ
jgi:hypothetical protein